MWKVAFFTRVVLVWNGFGMWPFFRGVVPEYLRMEGDVLSVVLSQNNCGRRWLHVLLSEEKRGRSATCKYITGEAQLLRSLLHSSWPGLALKIEKQIRSTRYDAISKHTYDTSTRRSEQKKRRYITLSRTRRQFNTLKHNVCDTHAVTVGAFLGVVPAQALYPQRPRRLESRGCTPAPAPCIPPRAPTLRFPGAPIQQQW